MSARYKRGCSNNLWIREDRLSSPLINALANNLLAPEVMKYFVGAVSEDLDSYLKGNSSSHESSLDQLRARESELITVISRLVAAIMNTEAGQSALLPAKLSEVEAQLKQIRADSCLDRYPRTHSFELIPVVLPVSCRDNRWRGLECGIGSLTLSSRTYSCPVA